ncbi:oligosaccharide repeat unit polymerase [Fibrobacter sp. UWS1]|nr:oligosaccharide repeat unit polymerase [Fibrobacter sp. UWS1]
MLILVANFTMYLMYTVFFSIRSRTLFTIHNLIACWFAIIAFVGVFAYGIGYYERVFGSVNSFSFEPYFFAFVAFLIFMWPFRQFAKKKVFFLGVPNFDNKKYKKLIKILMGLYLPFFLVLLNAAVHLAAYGGAEIYEAVHSEGVRLYQYSNLETKILWIFGTLFQVTQSFILFFVCISFTQMKNYKGSIGFHLLALLYVLSIIFLNNFVNGARGYLFFITISCAFLFLPFLSVYPKRIRSIFLILSFCLLGVFLSYTLAMTESRVESSRVETPMTSVARYLGEPFPNLDHLYYEKVRNHAMGVRMYGFLFPSNIADQLSLGEQHFFWERYSGVPILNYKTIWGDFYVEFGLVLSFLFMFVYAAILRIFIRKSQTISIEMFPIFWYYLEMAGYAPMLFSKRDYAGFRNLIICIILYKVIKLVRERKRSWFA